MSGNWTRWLIYVMKLTSDKSLFMLRDGKLGRCCLQVGKPLFRCRSSGESELRERVEFRLKFCNSMPT